MKKTGWIAGGLMAVLLACAQTAAAALISADLGPNRATVTTPIAGEHYIGDLKNAGNADPSDQIGIWENAGAVNIWNYTSYTGAAGLYDADGNVTGVGVTVTQSAASASNWGVDDLLSDGVYAEPNGGTVLWTITGLTPNAPYELVVYSSATYPATYVTVNFAGPTTPYTGIESPKDYAEGTQFWYFQVQADLEGRMNGASTNVSGDGTHNTFVGFQVMDAIPEPATFGLFGMAAVAMLLRRKLRG